jgi:ATP-dependent Clp protease ATP-binding subunit ClpA
LLFGKLEHGGTVKVTVDGKGEDAKLAFEYFPADPSKKPKARDEDDEDDAVPVLVDATPKKALPSPKDKKSSSKPSGAVPPVPRKKDE